MENVAYKPQDAENDFALQSGIQNSEQTQQYPQQSPVNLTVVTSGGYQPAIGTTPGERDWTIPAVLATIFCFCPTGICAIIAAWHARTQFQSGDTEGGRTSTAWAKWLTVTSIVLGIVLVATLIALYVTVFSVVNKAASQANAALDALF